jgi:antitoxin HicB
MEAKTLHQRKTTETEYRFTVRPLSPDEGGGYLVEFPDLPGCMSDGETIEEAIANGLEAKAEWIAAMREAGRSIPEPSGIPEQFYSGKWQIRAPRWLHRHLAERAEREGISLNTLAVSLLAHAVDAVAFAQRSSRPKRISHPRT